ncbi:MAG TPA: D-alanyl-D-alanine carboxypeptidase/D-alanyl-D-alanine-endopeptidase [Candidatus Baltobacteraceae bacterium]|nr:D-alanyl-D-alanine carboxypeptidase/D-alanyl-D-alanine-endopeptidase [Candidatus Baltobacteraceae bacterium]
MEKMAGMIDNVAGVVDAILERPDFAHSRIGIQIRDVRTSGILYGLNADQFFAGASTTKLITCAGALAALGPDSRFETGVFRTGEIDSSGVLHGDLVLVASGDPNLSGRICDDDTLEFHDTDHALAGYYPGTAPLVGAGKIFRDLANQIASNKITRIRGSVVIDLSLFPEGDVEAGTHAVISPVAVNDNLIDILVKGASAPGAPAELSFEPLASYARFVNTTRTTMLPDKRRPIEVAEGPLESSTRVVEVRGEIAPGDSLHVAYRVSEPSRFAAAMLKDALEEIGIAIDGVALAENGDRSLVAMHRSPPLREAVKVVLKVSQNLHAEMLLRLVRARGGAVFPFAPRTDAFQGDGCGFKAHFTPNFMCEFLIAARKAPWAEDLLHALPVLGHDGTLRNIQRDTRAASVKAVRAKTGTLSYSNVLDGGALMESKALAGFVSTASGRELAFAIFFSNVPFADEREPDAIGNLVASIAVAAYDSLS